MKTIDRSAIRLIATDLDETLLHKDKAFSDYSRQVLKKLIDKGYLAVPASGRDLKRMCRNTKACLNILRKSGYEESTAAGEWNCRNRRLKTESV